MLKAEQVEVWGFRHAVRGMRNPMNSWDKSDSAECFDNAPGAPCPGDDCDGCVPKYTMTGFYIGDNDLDLMRRLYDAGSEHRKYLRQIFVSMDITAPLYWWKEFDTYKIGTTSNSCSTMHKIAAKEFELDDFSHEHLMSNQYDTLETVIDDLNQNREKYLKTKEKEWWWQMIQLLPSSYNQRRTITMNYENVVSIIHQRIGHKLDEWTTLINELYRLPYIKEIME